LTKEPVLQYRSSGWMNSDGQTISTCLVYDPVQIELLVENPMRKQTTTSLVKVAIFRDNGILPDDKVKEESRIMTLPPLSNRTISIYFSPKQESGYHYTIFIEQEKVYDQPRKFPPRLYASRRETAIILDDPSNDFLAGSPVTLAGKLVSADTGEGISDAKINVYDIRHMRRDNLMGFGTTENDGTFIIERITKGTHWTKTVEIYAKFEGDDVYKPSTTSPLSLS